MLASSRCIDIYEFEDDNNLALGMQHSFETLPNSFDLEDFERQDVQSTQKRKKLQNRMYVSLNQTHAEML